MQSKRSLVGGVVILAILLTVIVYRSSNASSSATAALPLSRPAPLVARDVEKPAPLVPPALLRAASTKTSPDYISFPISERPGHTQQSSDLILAILHHPELALSKEEMDEILTAYIEVGAKRSEFEASIAQVKAVSPKENIITIPAYLEEGARLQEELYQKIEDVVGSARIARVRQALGAELYARNYGFGETEQEIKVTLLEGEPIRYAFAHSTGTLNLPSEQKITVKTTNADSVRTLQNLSAYAGLLNLLPKGGS